MLVYGDHSETACPRARLGEIVQRLGAAAALPPGLDRHSQLVTALIEAGRLVQGVADAEFEREQRDRLTADVDLLTTFTTDIAACVCRSWDSEFRHIGRLPVRPRPTALPPSVSMRLPEGYAFYALYPEAYIAAARSVQLHGPPRVIGIRSIGTSLGAIVAAAVDAPAPRTLRPIGDPFAREVAADWMPEPGAHYLIADEGPGQSGSSFLAVADWLKGHGIPHERITLLPSHGGEPARSSRREDWRQADRSVADFGSYLTHLLRTWLGSSEELVEISAGAWRDRAFARTADWPPACPMWERRKFIMRSQDGDLMVKFAGLGETGEAKLARARALYEAGLTPEPLALVHGFLVERWVSGTRLTVADRPLQEIGAYLTDLTQRFPGGSGANASALLAMCRRNIALALGDDWAREVDRWEPHLAALNGAMHRVAIDGRMDPHEWVLASCGGLLKTDALDHHLTHDPIGCQDIAWDIAGAAVEFGLDEEERAELVDVVERGSGQFVDRHLLGFLTLSYLAFRLGQIVVTLGSGPIDDAEELRLHRARARYEHAIVLQLSGERHGNDPQPSSLDVHPERSATGNKRRERSVDEEEAAASR